MSDDGGADFPFREFIFSRGTRVQVMWCEPFKLVTWDVRANWRGWLIVFAGLGKFYVNVIHVPKKDLP